MGEIKTFPPDIYINILWSSGKYWIDVYKNLNNSHEKVQHVTRIAQIPLNEKGTDCKINLDSSIEDLVNFFNNYKED